MQKDSTATLAQSITWTGSKQTYYTARLMVDKELVDDFYRAYAYFRWADDFVDVSSRSDEERLAFVKRQRDLIDRLYQHDRPDDLAPEEEMLVDLIFHDRQENSGLRSFINNMFAVIEFDALRKGRLISQQELEWYMDCLSRSVVDGIQYFVGNGHCYPDGENRYLAAVAAHIAHLLRDTISDTAEGFINIPREYLELHQISPDDVNSTAYRAWVEGQVTQARELFGVGKRYLDGLQVLRCKIVGYWYCARFEGVLNAIERDNYVLRPFYNERNSLSSWLRIARLGLSVSLQHIIRRDLYNGKTQDR